MKEGSDMEQERFTPTSHQRKVLWNVIWAVRENPHITQVGIDADPAVVAAESARGFINNRRWTERQHELACMLIDRALSSAVPSTYQARAAREAALAFGHQPGQRP